MPDELKPTVFIKDNITVKVDGKPFKCTCGCNVFHHPDVTNGSEIYECNACGEWYKGE